MTANKNNCVSSISQKKNKKFFPQGEILGINKFSKKTTENLFNYMDTFFDKNNKNKIKKKKRIKKRYSFFYEYLKNANGYDLSCR